MASQSLCNASRCNHLPSAWNELPVISSCGTLHREILSVSSEGSCWIWFQHLPFAFMIANTWTFLSSFNHCDTKPCLVLSFFSLLPCSSITITTSCFPVPSICSRDPVNDWFESLAECLHWNVRKKQNYLSSEDEEFWGRFQDLRGLVQGLQDSWGPGLSLTVLCAILSFTDMGGGWGRGRGGLGGVSPNSIQQTITLMLPFIRI